MRKEDIRPEELERECDVLIEQDRSSIDMSKLINVSCIACGSNDNEYSFNKHGFTYKRCSFCDSLYMSPRLSQEDLNLFFRESNAMRFWAERLYPATINNRRIVMAKRVELIKDTLSEIGIRFPVKHLLEIGPGYGLFLEKAKELNLAEYVSCVEPSRECCERIKKEQLANVYNATLDEFKTDNKFDLIILNGVLEHPFSLRNFLGKVKSLLPDSGVIVACSPGGSGVDTKVLREKTSNVEPPQMQNFVSERGWDILSNTVGLILVNYTSIGELDVNLLYSELSHKSDVISQEIAFLLGDQTLREDFQYLLKKHKKTGFYMVVLKKK